jgi:hypothetical protein
MTTNPVAAQELLALMRRLSLQFWGTSWESGLEYMLDEATHHDGPMTLNGYQVDRFQIDDLVTLSSRAGGWWSQDEEGAPVFVTAAAWHDLVSQS